MVPNEFADEVLGNLNSYNFELVESSFNLVFLVNEEHRVGSVLKKRAYLQELKLSALYF